jgi:hypothetical protein
MSPVATLVGVAVMAIMAVPTSVAAVQGAAGPASEAIAPAAAPVPGPGPGYTFLGDLESWEALPGGVLLHCGGADLDLAFLAPAVLRHLRLRGRRCTPPDPSPRR